MLGRQSGEARSGAAGPNGGWPCHLGCFLASMQLLVLNETCAPLEGFPTHLTLIRPLPSVEPLMLDQGDLLIECLPALLAAIGLLPSVDSLVFG